jgi:NADPH2:quinone reductase
MRAITIEAFGGPEVLTVRDRDPLTPGPGEAVVDVAATGINFIDVYHRTGRYPNQLPLVIGSEGAGTVSAVGEGVTEVAVGDRVCWVLVLGSYAEQAVVPVDKLVPIPDGMDTEVAAAALLQGLTAHYLTQSVYAVKPGDVVVVHAAAGGMGLLLTQLATHLGAQVVATASTPSKLDLAREAGASVAVPYAEVGEAVRKATGGKGAAAVYDGVGKDTFATSLGLLRPRGSLVAYGAASGPVPPLDIIQLMSAGSVFLSRPTLGHFVLDRDELLSRAADLFGWIGSGVLSIPIHGRYPLAEAQRAHEDLEARRTTGKLLLHP